MREKKEKPVPTVRTMTVMLGNQVQVFGEAPGDVRYEAVSVDLNVGIPDKPPPGFERLWKKVLKSLKQVAKQSMPQAPNIVPITPPRTGIQIVGPDGKPVKHPGSDHGK